VRWIRSKNLFLATFPLQLVSDARLELMISSGVTLRVNRGVVATTEAIQGHSPETSTRSLTVTCANFVNKTKSGRLETGCFGNA
jgi:hypothetical protein